VVGPPNNDLHGDTKPVTRSIRPSDGRPLQVFTDIPHVEEFLTRPEFVLSKILFICVPFLYQQFI
jgi:hypothetical protein